MKQVQVTKRKSLIEYGDILEVNGHKIACGDARDPELVAKLVGNKKVSLVATDVPYGVAMIESKEGFQKISVPRRIANDHYQSDKEYRNFTREWIEAIKPHLAQKNAFYIFNSDRMVWALREGMLDAGCKLAQLLIWVKTHAVVGRMDYHPQHELIVYGWVGTHAFQKSKDKSVLIYPKPQKSKLHPTMKPAGLMRRLILNSSKIGDTVYDGFLGSGTTALAAEQTKRKCFGVELDPEYCLVSVERLEKLVGVNAKKINHE